MTTESVIILEETCGVCNYPAKTLHRYLTKQLCTPCYHTGVGSTVNQHFNMSTESLAKAVSYQTNMILDAIAELRGKQ